MIEIRHLHSLDEMHALLAVADRVWGITPGGLVGADYLIALEHAGGYVAGAVDDSNGEMVAASFGMLSRHGGEWCLHSHITGVVPELQGTGLGRRMKFHQRDWARAAGLAAITWTFDPLVRRNAWFNLRVLGAVGVEYLPNFYGPLNDDINGPDDSDRLLVRWSTSRGPAAGGSEPPTSELVTVELPDDIVALRRTDPEAARLWRRTLRDELSPLLRTHVAVDSDEGGRLVLRRRTDDT